MGASITTRQLRRQLATEEGWRVMFEGLAGVLRG
jgi:hypothetical protein